MLLLLLLLLLLFPPKQFAHDILEHLPPIFPTQTQRSLIDLSGLRLEGSTSVPVYLFKKEAIFFKRMAARDHSARPGVRIQTGIQKQLPGEIIPDSPLAIVILNFVARWR